ncbi:DciA family protein [Georgenia sp. TF02-10]|uniref:DUF721 domain-containing protein n=1 Tax=Georgenia sp. TF02-10 TaxID=2917725 RepID=UPI001FA7DA58|nr:DciA family protein [Georgenia sp. TF02-10]UNX54969.1 DciA family protein [Georgenia sp. TF02-10]
MTEDAERAVRGTGDPADADAADVAARRALDRAREATRAKGVFRTRSRRTGQAAGAAGAGGDDGGASTWRAGPGLGDGISGPAPSGRDPQPLGGLAAHLLLQRGWRQPVSVGGVVGRWREVVGDQLADHCQVETFDGTELVVRASSTAWATQVRLLLPQLQRRLAEEVGEGTVTSIVVLGPGGPSWRRGPRSVRGRGPRDTYG